MAEPSGAQWCARFPTSVSLDDLAEPFRSKARAFVQALRDAGASVTVSATYRPAERAYLMHWCCMIADGGQDPAAVPPKPGVAIDWCHGADLAAAKAAAQAMRQGYGIVYPAALESRHTQRLAVDMTIRFQGALQVRTGNGVGAAVASQGDLVPVGRSYGVFKLLSDPPHWSSDGH